MENAKHRARSPPLPCAAEVTRKAIHRNNSDPGFDNQNTIEDNNDDSAIELSNESVFEDRQDGRSSESVGEERRGCKTSLRVQFHDTELCDTEVAPSILSEGSNCSSEDESLDHFSEQKPPDGGWGWVIVAAAFLTNLIADGITFTFGIIYVELLKYFQEGKSKTAWIGGLFMAMPLLSGPIASYLTDRWGCRVVCILGALLSALGFIVSSFADSIELLIFSFGIVSGFGLALCYVSAVVIVAYYFDKRRSLATGLAVCGSGIGTFVFAPLTHDLIAEYGWRGATLILAGFFLHIIVFGALMRDLEWTKAKSKALRKHRKTQHRERRNKSRSQSLRTATSSTESSQQIPALPSVEELRRLLQSGVTPDYMLPPILGVEVGPGSDEASRLCYSALNLPTYVHEGDKVPAEVLQLLSSNPNMYHILLQNYPNLFTSSRSVSEGMRLHSKEDGKPLPQFLRSPQSPSCPPCSGQQDKGPRMEQEASWWQQQAQATHPQRRISAAYLKDPRLHKQSLTYRGAILNIKRYRLRATSCPDIYRNSNTTMDEEQAQWYAFVWDLRDVLVDMVDVSHFTDNRFVLFAVSNFLLYSWYHVPYVFLTDKAIEMGFKDDDASYLISYLGVFNMVGEIFLGWAGDQPWINAGVVYALSMALCGVVTGVVPLITSYMGLAVVAGGFGLTIAANYSLSSIILVELITLERFTNAFGLLLLVQGVANLVGPPLAGWLYDVSGDYDLSFYLAGVSITLCGVLLIILPAMEWIKRLKRRSRTNFVKATANKTMHNKQQNNFIYNTNTKHKPKCLLKLVDKEINPV